MKKGTKITALLILGLVLTSILIGVVSAEGPTDFLKDIFKKLFSPEGLKSLGFETQITIVKFLLVVLLAILVYSIISATPLFDNDKIKWALWPVSIIIAYLATFYWIPADLIAILQTYNAMGLALTTVLPFLIILAFYWEMAKHPNKANVAIGGFLLALFSFFLVYRLAVLISFPPQGIPQEQLNLARWTYGIFLAIALLSFVFRNKIFEKLFKWNLTNYIERSKVLSANIAAARAADLRQLASSTTITDEQRKMLEETAKELDKYAEG